jgi:hypothetical protein
MKKRGIFAVWISIVLLTGLFTGCGNKSAKAVEPINNSKGIRENEEKMCKWIAYLWNIFRGRRNLPSEYFMS